MSDLRTAAQQALGFVTSEAWGTTPYMDVRVYEDAARLRDVLQAALAQQAEPAQEPAYKVKVTGRWHDTEPLAAAFSLPDGEHLLYTAPPQRKQAEPAQEPITRLFGTLPVHDTQQALAQQAEPDHETRAELAEQQVVQLAEERDHYRNLWQKAQQDEPVEPVGWNWMLDGQPYGQAYYGNPPDTDIAERAAIAGRTVRLLYTAPPPPQRKPLTEEEIDKIFKHLCNTVGASCKTMARAVERAHGIKE